MAESPLLVLSGDVPGTDPLETARGLIGELGPTGWVPLPDPRSAEPGSGEPWLLLRTAGLLADAFVDLQPYGPRLLTGQTRLSREQDEAFASQLESFHLAMALEGGTPQPRVTMTLLGPVTLAATLHTTLGERVSADHGALAFAAESLAEGVSQFIRAAQAAYGLVIDVTLSEPLLEAALEGRLPTASGWQTHRRLSREQLRSVYRIWGEATAGTPSRLTGVGEQALALDAAEAGGLAAVSAAPRQGVWTPDQLDAAEELLSSGLQVLFELPAGDRAATAGADSPWMRSLLESAERVGVPDELRADWGLWAGPGLREAAAAPSSFSEPLLAAARSLRQDSPTSAL